MKPIAFYLPQYHSIPENDKWWGKGFTEWDNVKKSVPLYKGHNQPEIPLNKNYYNLLDVKVQEEQAAMAKEYGLYGFCYYHYWFSGKMLLEKPMENMLKNKCVDIPFCICWANETWSRTWDGNASDILIEQNYEENTDGWKNHFEYLLPFFKDNRYIKHGNKPMMIIYKPQLFSQCEIMMDYWNNLAIENGFDGLYWGYQHRSAYDSDICEKVFDFGIEFEPFFSVREFEIEKNLKYQELGAIGSALKRVQFLVWKAKKQVLNEPIFFDYDKIWSRIIKRKPCRTRVYPGAFTSWDNTPRRGRKGTVFKGATPQKFENYLTKQILHTKKYYDSEYLFINAWNEWAEGAHLEPDEHNGYGYLNALKRALEKNI